MNAAREPLDWSQFNHPEQEILRHYRITQVINVPKFVEVNGYEPSIGSIFRVSDGGSYAYEDPVYGHTYIHNGTLSRPHVNDAGYRFMDGRVHQ